MEFDLLVRKYLRGTLSPPELERLRDLLERVPEYRTELRQILELRSIIHDDALRLVPPRELSERTRETVGARFAGLESILQHDASRLDTPGELADATRMTVGALFASAAASDPVASHVARTTGAGDDIADDEREPRRRALIFPYRIVDRVLLAASIAVMVAVAPSLLTPTLGPGGSPTSTTGPLASLDAPATGGRASGAGTSDPMSAAAAPTNDGITPLVVASVAASHSNPQHDGMPAPRRIGAGGSFIASISAPSESEGATVATPTPAEIRPTLAATDTAASVERPLVLDADNPLAALLAARTLRLGDAAYRPAADSSTLRRGALAVLNVSPAPVPGESDDRRLLAVGVTLGSGNVMDADAPAALMQNSYYFSFSVSGTDRIGIEMGGSTFMQETQVPNKRPVGNIFAKQGAGDSSASSSLRAGVAAAPTVVARMKQDITYGGVFYDRRLEVDRSWDVCGRLTFGAADGALVAGVRAYTAYSPTKNVTLTLGIGGSTLFNLSSRTEEASTNYGLYYGIETGF
jgi:hypothetical protein